MRTPSFKGNVLVANLPEHVTATELADMFDSYGLVLGAVVSRWSHKPGLKGLVALAPEDAVTAAIAGLDGTMLGAVKLSVSRIIETPKRPKPKTREQIVAAINAFRANSAPEPAPLPVAAVKKPIVEYRSLSGRRFLPRHLTGAGAGDSQQE